MTRFLHTSDLHLTRDDATRLNVLNWIIEKANELDIDYLIIAGDLFESDTDATVLRPKVKNLLEKINAEVLIIPGNHDEKSYDLKYDYGKNVRQLIEKPYQILDIGPLKICGIPYQNMKFTECIKDLSGGLDLAIVHGTLLDDSFSQILTAERIEYLPIYPSSLENLARYVAFGHFHTQYLEKNYARTKIVYPGSPIALSTKCASQRVVVYIELDKDKIKVQPLEVEIAPYWQVMEYFVFPEIEASIFSTIEEDIQRLDKRVMPFIIVKGFISTGEKEFLHRLLKIKDKFAGIFSDFNIVSDEITAWDKILRHTLVKRFVERTQGLPDELRMKIFEIALPVFNDLRE
ncbi:MAG: metallophosphoesterase [candidate division WOR-3 bacterium]